MPEKFTLKFNPTHPTTRSLQLGWLYITSAVHCFLLSGLSKECSCNLISNLNAQEVNKYQIVTKMENFQNPILPWATSNECSTRMLNKNLEKLIALIVPYFINISNSLDIPH
jgi:hypothetical protein